MSKRLIFCQIRGSFIAVGFFLGAWNFHKHLNLGLSCLLLKCVPYLVHMDMIYIQTLSTISIFDFGIVPMVTYLVVLKLYCIICFIFILFHTLCVSDTACIEIFKSNTSNYL